MKQSSSRFVRWMAGVAVPGRFWARGVKKGPVLPRIWAAKVTALASQGVVCSSSAGIIPVTARPASSRSTWFMLLRKARWTWLNVANNPRVIMESRAMVTRISTKVKAGEVRGAWSVERGACCVERETAFRIPHSAFRIPEVLITGESGTGKELAAKALHYNSSRVRKPFVALNCAALPETLLESELFGIEKGVATGVNSRVGQFQKADGGTLFLDEIGDLSLTAQAKILRVLQERVMERVGGRNSIPVDVRLLAATNKDLEAEIAKGNFREDLYYRIKVIHIHMPPLREIREEIPLLANHFLQEFCRAR